MYAVRSANSILTRMGRSFATRRAQYFSRGRRVNIFQHDASYPGNIAVFFSRIYILVLLACLLPAQVHADKESAILTLRAVNLLLLSGGTCSISYDSSDPKYDIAYQGLWYYRPEMSHTNYVLPQLDDREFNRLPLTERRKIADKLLSSLFFGYPAPALDRMLNSGTFLCTIRQRLFSMRNNMNAVEAEIRDEEKYYRGDNSWRPYEAFDILARF